MSSSFPKIGKSYARIWSKPISKRKVLIILLSTWILYEVKIRCWLPPRRLWCNQTGIFQTGTTATVMNYARILSIWSDKTPLHFDVICCWSRKIFKSMFIGYISIKLESHFDEINVNGCSGSWHFEILSRQWLTFKWRLFCFDVTGLSVSRKSIFNV